MSIMSAGQLVALNSGCRGRVSSCAGQSSGSMGWPLAFSAETDIEYGGVAGAVMRRVCFSVEENTLHAQRW
jgi:hypothetical protein